MLSLSKSIAGRTIHLQKGDITLVKADAIVNAANSQLAGGGGVDGAIHRAAGPAIMRELDGIRARIGRCEPGKAVATGAGKLDAKYIFHAVGPVYRDGAHGEPEQLASCYRECLGMAAERDLKTIAFAAISTGVYGYPMDEAATIAIREIAAFVRHQSSVEEVRMVLFNEGALRAFEHALDGEPSA
jgi:O-acetyl-ADP-ribose deacetylase (regulator of RNase III)